MSKEEIEVDWDTIEREAIIPPAPSVPIEHSDFCDRCGKDLRNPNSGTISSGWTIEIRLEDERERAYTEKQLGKYKYNKRYSFCWECMLDAFFAGRQPIDRGNNDWAF